MIGVKDAERDQPSVNRVLPYGSIKGSLDFGTKLDPRRVGAIGLGPVLIVPEVEMDVRGMKEPEGGFVLPKIRSRPRSRDARRARGHS